MDRCLNCGAELGGPFCAACGQRAVPPDPTVLELAGDAWQELTGYDGRIAVTIRGLLRPGRLTTEYLGGHRAKYLPPVRLYLIVSIIYFLVAAAAPPTPPRRAGEETMSVGITIGIWSSSNATLTAAQRQEVLAELEDAPAWVRPMLRAMVEDSEQFRQRLFTTMPRVFVGLLPVFAAILALFYWRRRFPTHLVFAVHVHAFAFAGFAIAELVKFSRNDLIQAALGVAIVLSIVAYALMAFRAVYGGGWVATIAKAAGIGVVYLAVSMPVFFLIMAWAAS